MWNALESKCRQAQNIWSEVAYKKIAEKDVIISDLSNKLRKLEDDFTYNFNLLNIREQENLRCRNEITELIRRLKSESEKGVELESLLANNGRAVKKLEFIHDKDKNTLQKLSLIIRNLKTELSSRQKVNQLQTSALQDKDQQIQKMENELQHLRENNQQLIHENEKLAANINVTNSQNQHIEINLTKKLREIEEKLRNLRNEKILLTAENVKLIETHAKLETQYLIESNKNIQMMKESESANNLNVINKKLNEQIVMLKEQIDEMSIQNTEIKSSYNYIKQIACTLIENRNEILHIVKKLKDNRGANDEFERLTKQNFILKDVIKKLKHDRDDVNVVTTEKTTDSKKTSDNNMDYLKQQFVTQYAKTHHRLSNISEENS